MFLGLIILSEKCVFYSLIWETYRLSIKNKPVLPDKMKWPLFWFVDVLALMYNRNSRTLKKRLKWKLEGNYTRMLRDCNILTLEWAVNQEMHLCK